jgi:hypothetical protein
MMMMMMGILEKWVFIDERKWVFSREDFGGIVADL